MGLLNQYDRKIKDQKNKLEDCKILEKQIKELTELYRESEEARSMLSNVVTYQFSFCKTLRRKK